VSGAVVDLDRDQARVREHLHRPREGVHEPREVQPEGQLVLLDHPKKGSLASIALTRFECLEDPLRGGPMSDEALLEIAEDALEPAVLEFGANLDEDRITDIDSIGLPQSVAEARQIERLKYGSVKERMRLHVVDRGGERFHDVIEQGNQPA